MTDELQEVKAYSEKIKMALCDGVPYGKLTNLVAEASDRIDKICSPVNPATLGDYQDLSIAISRLRNELFYEVENDPKTMRQFKIYGEMLRDSHDEEHFGKRGGKSYLYFLKNRTLNPLLVAEEHLVRRVSKLLASPNSPKKGGRITVEPIRNLKDINAIKKLLENEPRNHLLFVMGINNGLRVGDLLRLRTRSVNHLNPGEYIPLIESKTCKGNVLIVNKTVHKALMRYLEATNPGENDLLFQSRKTQKAITTQTVNALVKKWTNAIDLSGNYGAQTLRKTFGYIQCTQFGVGLEILAKRYNHPSPAITMRYLGIMDQEVNKILMNEI